MTRGRFALACLGGCSVHLAVLIAPLWILGELHLSTDRLSIPVFLCIATMLCFCDMRFCSHENPAPGIPKGASQPRTIQIALFAGVTLLALFWAGLVERALRQGPCSLSWVSVGAIIMVAGTLLRTMAIRELGPGFITELALRGDRPLVTTGVYGAMRHPSEAGNLLTGLGACIVLESGVAFLIFCFLYVPLTVTRMHEEDRFLRAMRPSEFRETRSCTPRLIPFVY